MMKMVVKCVSHLHSRLVLAALALLVLVYTLMWRQSAEQHVRSHRNRIADRNADTHRRPNHGFRVNDANGRFLYYHLPHLDGELDSRHYRSLADNDCLTAGTNWSASTEDCVCLDGYYGDDCGIPSIVWRSTLFNEQHIDVRRVSRAKRLVLSVILLPSDCDSTLDFMNDTLSTLLGVIDLFIVSQVILNDTRVDNHSLSHSLANGHLKQYSHIVLLKPIMISGDEYRSSDRNGLQMYALSQLWSTSVKCVTEFRHNDLFIYMSSNSRPLTPIALFLKYYEGFPEPIHLISSERHSNLFNIVVSFEYLTLLCRYDFDLFVRSQCIDDKTHVNKFVTNFWPIKSWRIGSSHERASITCHLSNK